MANPIQTLVLNAAKEFLTRKSTIYAAGVGTAALTIRKTVQVLYKDQNGSQKEKQILLAEVERYYIDNLGKINTDNRGTLIAIVYEGNNGHYYKDDGTRMRVWDQNTGTWA